MYVKIPKKESKVAKPSSLSGTRGPPYRLTFTPQTWTDKSPKLSTKRPAASGFQVMNVNLYILTGTAIGTFL